MRSWIGAIRSLASVVTMGTPHALPEEDDAGESKQGSVLGQYVPGSPAAARFLPLVEAARRHEAAELAEGVAERRPLGERFGARVDHLSADAPAQQLRAAPAGSVVAHGERSEERRVGKECRSRW